MEGVERQTPGRYKKMEKKMDGPDPPLSTHPSTLQHFP